MKSYSSILLIICCTINLLISKLEAAPVLVPTGLQFLPSHEGYIPVYIRYGDTPLEEINPELAEAFHFYDKKQKQLIKQKEQENKIDDDVKIEHADDTSSLLPKQLKLLNTGFKFGDEVQIGLENTDENKQQKVIHKKPIEFNQ